MVIIYGGRKIEIIRVDFSFYGLCTLSERERERERGPKPTQRTIHWKPAMTQLCMDPT
jgi:hypothetical protein